MELVAIEQTTVTSLFVVSNPQGQPGLLDLTQGAIERYGFAECPTKIEEVTGNKVHFGYGKFDGVGIDSFDVYPDGVLVQARCNSVSIDAFLDDILRWAEATFGLRTIKTARVEKSYDSTLLVQTDANVLGPIEKLKSIQSLLSDTLKSATGREADYHSYGWSMAADSSALPSPLTPDPFRIERKVGMPFERNYFVTEASLPTDDHMKILAALEKLVA